MQLAFMLDIGLKVLSTLKEMPFRKNYLHYFSVVLSPKTITFGGKNVSGGCYQHLSSNLDGSPKRGGK